MSLGKSATPLLALDLLAPASEVDPAGARLLKLLADPTRRRIVLALMRGETCNCELAEQLGLAQNLISHHVKQLREAGLVRERRDECDARWVYYSLNAEAYAAAWAALEATLNPASIRTRVASCRPQDQR